MSVKVVSDEEAERADYLVCLRADLPTPFDDNETGECCKCGVAVQFRPYSPKAPPRVCFECFQKSQAH